MGEINLINLTNLKKMLPFLLVNAMVFYLLPVVSRIDENFGDTGMLMVLLLIVTPAVCLICSVAYGIFYSFNIFYSFITALIFVPVVFIFYNSSAWVYIIAYGIVALVGNAFGMFFHGLRVKL